MKLLSVLAAILIFAGCAGQQPRAETQVYQSPSPIPASFDMEVTPLPDGKYQFDGKAQTLTDLYWKIQNSQHTDHPVHTVLYHLGPKPASMQYMCFIALMYERDMAAYATVPDGRPGSVTVTSSSRDGFAALMQQCLDGVPQS